MPWQLVQDLILLASDPDEQLAYLRRSQLANEELLVEWTDWYLDLYHMQRANHVLDFKGTLALVDSLTATINALNLDCARELTAGPEPHLLSDDGIRHGPRWQALRELANDALIVFRDSGIRTPRLSDSDYIRPESDDAP